MKIPLLRVSQPVGVFYLGLLSAEVVISITEVQQRDSKGGIQRRENSTRVSQISRYCGDPDATFPTPIIVSLYNSSNYIFNAEKLELQIIDITKTVGEVIDGQHRIAGLKMSDHAGKFELPVVFMFGLTEEQKAYIFSTINSTQTKVSMSLIYDLFELSKGRSPQKTCHEIARTLNSDDSSPFYRRLKMLGYRTVASESLSQGEFVSHLIRLISGDPQKDLLEIKQGEVLSPDPKRPLRDYFISDEDSTIYKILFNVFSAVQDVFPEEWNNPREYILSKTTGYGAILRAMRESLIPYGKENMNLSQDFFREIFANFKELLKKKELTLTSKDFPSNAQQQKKMAGLISKGLPKK